MSVTRERRYWIGVVSRSHVEHGKEGGFAQLGHGKGKPLRRLHPGDWLVYYSPKTAFEDGTPLQAFTAIGEVVDDRVYQHRMSDDFVPFRRDVAYRDSREAPIQPLIEIPKLDFAVIAAAMGVEARETDAA